MEPVETEIWKKIPETNYEASSLGRIRHHKFQRILKSSYNNGYEIVKPNGMKGTKKVHRLVALAFLENPDNLPDVDHLNGDKKDNRLANLCWKSKKDNMRAFFDNTEQFEKRSKYQPLRFWNETENHVFKSIQESCRHFNRCLGTMWGVAVNVREGKTKKWLHYNVELVSPENYETLKGQNGSCSA